MTTTQNPTTTAAAFDPETGRCLDCDGHYKHAADCPTFPYANTSAVATIEGNPIATVHASPMADTLASYQRSVALIIDRSEVHVLLRALQSTEGLDEDRARVLAEALAGAIEDGLR